MAQGDRQEGLAIEPLDDGAAQQGLARADIAGQHDERLPPLERVGHLRERGLVRRALEAEPRVRHEAERRLGQPEERFVAFHAPGRRGRGHSVIVSKQTPKYEACGPGRSSRRRKRLTIRGNLERIDILIVVTVPPAMGMDEEAVHEQRPDSRRRMIQDDPFGAVERGADRRAVRVQDEPAVRIHDEQIKIVCGIPSPVLPPEELHDRLPDPGRHRDGKRNQIVLFDRPARSRPPERTSDPFDRQPGGYPAAVG